MDKTIAWRETWFQLGIKNPWIRESYDPPFTRESIYAYDSAEELAEVVGSDTSWCLGTACCWDDQCWINQVEGGSEWMVIKQDVSFESMSGRHMGPEEVLLAIKAIANSTVEECRRLDYKKNAEAERV